MLPFAMFVILSILFGITAVVSIIAIVVCADNCDEDYIPWWLICFLITGTFCVLCSVSANTVHKIYYPPKQPAAVEQTADTTSTDTASVSKEVEIWDEEW